MTSPLDPQIGVIIQNDSGSVIPPRSVVVATSVETVAGDENTNSYSFTHVTQYSGQAGNIMVTGPTYLGVGLKGLAFYDDFLYVSIDPDATEPAAGDVWGPVSGSWVLGSTGNGFVCQGYSANGGNPKRAMFYRVPPALGARIHFVINSVDYGAATVRATILEKTCGVSLSGLNNDGSVTVYDSAGCWLRAPTGYTDCNIGRHGYADYMEIYGYPGACRWIMNPLCPPDCVLVLKDFSCNSDGTITKIQTKVTGCC